MIRKLSRGFTIVELIVVVSTIAILAAIAIFGFGTWRTSVANTEMKNELGNAAAAIKMYRNVNNVYPTVLSNIPYTPSASVSLTYTVRGGGGSYCLNARSTVMTSAAHYYLDSNISLIPTTTACS
ncbi:MAG: prepilin-type N-terminal cleavage/methylation domain-containing protein [Candidatus Saccharimonas sp.]